MPFPRCQTFHLLKQVGRLKLLNVPRLYDNKDHLAVPSVRCCQANTPGPVSPAPNKAISLYSPSLRAT